MSQTDIVNFEFEYTNSCECMDENPETGEFDIPSAGCYGYCFDSVLEDFEEITSHLFKMNNTNFWRIANIRLWNGDVSGIVKADSPAKLLESMGVNSVWNMRGTVHNDHISYSLSHHDAPMGSSSAVYIVSEKEAEEMEL